MQAPPRCEEATKRVSVKQWNKAHETKSDHDKHGKGKGKHKKDESDSEGDDSDDPCECDLCVEHNEAKEVIKAFKECEGICEETIVPDDRFKFKSTETQIEQRKVLAKFLLQNGLAKTYGPAVAMRRVLEAEIDKHDWCQVECGMNHCMLLNTLGQVFTFGDGLKG